MKRRQAGYTLVEVLVVIVIMALLVALGYGIWTIKKKVNYSFQYRTMVEQTVRDMVKEECLKK